MLNLSVKKIKMLEECERKFYYQEVLQLQSEKDTLFEVLNTAQTVVKNSILIKDYDSAYNEVKATLSTIKDEWFNSIVAKNETIEYYQNIFYRYIDFEKQQNREIIRFNATFSTDVVIGENIYTIPVTIDYIIKDGDSYEAIKIKRSKPTLSSRARKPENKPEYDIELALIYKALSPIYPNLKVSFYHLINKDDTKSKLVDNFNYKPNTNIVTAEFDNDKLNKVMDRIAGLDIYGNNKNTENCEHCSYNSVCNQYISDENQNIPHIIPVYKEPSFNEKQKKVVYHVNGAMRVLAAPGSGKTATLVTNVLHLIEQGIPAKSILFLTFTNKAVGEIKERLELMAKAKNVNIDGITISTYNSFGYDILKKHSSLLGIDNAKLLTKLDIYNLFDEMSCLYRIPDVSYSNPYAPAYGLYTKLYRILERTLDKGLLNNIETFKEEFNNIFKEDEQLNIIFEGFNWLKNRIEEKGLITYSDQIRLVNEIFNKHPDILRFYQQKYRYIRLDEFQDTDREQMKMVYSIAQGHGNIVVVGDDDQAIYTWRNADNSNLLNFHKYFNCTDVILDQNYRSTKSILKYANYVIANNKERFGKKLVGVKEYGKEPEIINDEIDIIPNIINNLIIEGYNYKDIAIIGRNNSELNDCYEILKTANIPAANPRDYLIKNSVFKLIFSSLKYMLDYDIDDVELLTMLQPLGFTEKEIENRNVCKCSLHNYLLCNYNSTYLNLIDSLSLLKNKGDLIDDNYTIKHFIQNILEIYNISSNLPIVDTLYELIEQYEISTLQDMYYLCYSLIKIEDDIVIDNDNIQSNSIRFFTGHGAKGKEFKCVILLGSNFAYEEGDEFEEEQRRLFFVSITRAQERLFILDNKRKGNLHYLIDELPCA